MTKRILFHSCFSFGSVCLLMLISAAAFSSSSCKPSNLEKRQYREIVVSRPTPPPAGQDRAHGHDHSGDQALPEGHPPVGSGMDSGALPPSMRGGAEVDLAWDVPAGWTETPGKGMRRAAFSAEGSQMLCTIVALGGSAGGMESNVRRWLGQVGLDLDAEALASLLESLEKGSTSSGLIWSWVDFNPLLKDPTEPSMKAVLLEKEGSTVFIKMTGSGSELAVQDGAMRALVDSIR